MAAPTLVYARNVAVNGRTYAVRPPAWGEWQAAMAAGLGAGRPGEVDAAALLELCLLPCLTGPQGAVGLAELRALPAAAGDSLLAAALDLLESERERLDLRRTDGPEGVTLHAGGLQLRLRPWTFGERNRALGACFRLVAGEPCIDMAAFERAMVSTCVTAVAGEAPPRPVTPAEAAGWPVPLGEAVVQVLDELNGLDPQRDEVLQACVQRGIPHPDLTLLHLCRTFGWTPAVAESLEARQAERLMAALRALSAPPAATAAGPAQSGGEVTRIIVSD
jgi:hypothetical protein